MGALRTTIGETVATRAHPTRIPGAPWCSCCWSGAPRRARRRAPTRRSRWPGSRRLRFVRHGHVSCKRRIADPHVLPPGDAATLQLPRQHLRSRSGRRLVVFAPRLRQRAPLVAGCFRGQAFVKAYRRPRADGGERVRRAAGERPDRVWTDRRRSDALQRHPGGEHAARAGREAAPRRRLTTCTQPRPTRSASRVTSAPGPALPAGPEGQGRPVRLHRARDGGALHRRLRQGLPHQPRGCDAI